MWLAGTPEGPRLKVSESSFQYQDDQDGKREIFRYDYLRQSNRNEPASHLNIYGNLTVPDVLPPGKPLSRVHFPAGRVPLEAVIRMLVDDFGVPAATDESIWRPVLAASEEMFMQIAHRV